MNTTLSEEDVDDLIRMMGKCVHEWYNPPALPDVWRCAHCQAAGFEEPYLDFSSPDKSWMSFGRLLHWAKTHKHPTDHNESTALDLILESFPILLTVKYLDPKIFAKWLLSIRIALSEFTMDIIQ
jgi:hypothetical protein